MDAFRLIQLNGPTLIGILRDSGLDERTAGFMVALDADIAAGMLAETSSELSAILGRPTTPLKAGLNAAVHVGPQ